MIANRIAYGKTLAQLVKENPNVMVVDADVCKSTGTLPVYEQAPESFIQCGIAEQNMMGIAAGLAMCGKTVFAAAFAVFTCMRALDQVRNSICYPNVNVKIAGTHAGIETGGDGASHQAIEDVAIMRALPHMVVTAPATPNATAKLTRLAAEIEGPFYIRMGRDPAPELYDEAEEFPLGGSKQLAEGKDITILAHGGMVWRAAEAAKLLGAEGISVRVLDMYSIKPIDEGAIIRAAKETRLLLSVEDHSVIGGLGGAIAEVLTTHAPARLVRMGMQDEFGRAGLAEKLYEMFHLTPKDICERAKGALGI